MALSYIDSLMIKQLNNPPIIDESLLDDINGAIIKETYNTQHQEIHRIYDKEKVKIPIANLQNRWIYLNGQLALYNETNASMPIERLIYYEVTSKKLWLECIINDKFISHETSIIQLLLIEHQDFKSILSTSVNIDFSLCNNRKEFADQTLLVLNVRWKKYLERVYLSLMDLYIIIKNFI